MEHRCGVVVRIGALPVSPPEDRIEPALPLPAPRPVRPGLQKSYQHVRLDALDADRIEPCPSPAIKRPACAPIPTPAVTGAVCWRNTPLPRYRRSDQKHMTQSLFEFRIKERLGKLPMPETLSAACWQQLDSINRKDAARLIDRLSNGQLFLKTHNVHLLAVQKWSRPHLRQFLCWLLYLDRGAENIVGYTADAKMALKALLDVLDLDEAQIYIDLSQCQRQEFHHKARMAFVQWDSGTVTVEGTAISAMRLQMYEDLTMMRSFLLWLIGRDGFGMPYHTVKLVLTQEGAREIIDWLSEKEDSHLWTIARLWLPNFADAAFWQI